MTFTQMRRAATFCIILGLRRNEVLSLSPGNISEDGMSIFDRCGNGTRQISVPTDYVKEIKDTRDMAIEKQQSKLFD